MRKPLTRVRELGKDDDVDRDEMSPPRRGPADVSVHNGDSPSSVVGGADIIAIEKFADEIGAIFSPVLETPAARLVVAWLEIHRRRTYSGGGA